MLAHLGSMAAYNRWANDRLYTVVAGLGPEEYRANRGAFFGSIEGTLNHILVADRIWLARLGGDGLTNLPLDGILEAEFTGLRTARAEQDARLVAFVAGLAEGELGKVVSYQNSSGATFSQPIRDILAHVLNHQTHHRGQATTLLSQLGLAVPSLDLVTFQRGVGQRAA